MIASEAATNNERRVCTARCIEHMLSISAYSNQIQYNLIWALGWSKCIVSRRPASDTMPTAGRHVGEERSLEGPLEKMNVPPRGHWRYIRGVRDVP